MESHAGGSSSSSVHGMASSPPSGKLDAAEDTHQLGGGGPLGACGCLD